MIVSFFHRFVFVAIPKTASQAVRRALRPHLGARDWEQCALFERKSFPVQPLASLRHGHLTCEQVQPFLLANFWESSVRFCVVRNPFDRLVSSCRFLNRDNQRMRHDPIGTMKRALSQPTARWPVLVRPQHEFVTDRDGRLLVNRVCRYERLTGDFESLCATLRLPVSGLPHVNASDPLDGPTAFDRELQETVVALYERDFEIFGYPRSPGVMSGGRATS